jgi:hypothetical protein
MPSPAVLHRLSEAMARFGELRRGNDSLLRLLDESEIPGAAE